jgi:trehalose synthase
MVELIKLRETITLDDYSSIAYLASAVQELRTESAPLVRRLQGHSVLMVNSAAQGGGVAEMLPKMVMLLQELGVRTQWAVIGGNHPEFFKFTKRIHNLIHGAGDPVIKSQEQKMYDSISRAHADALRTHLGPDDILAVHDPQPLGAGAILKKELDIRAIWRCHIGLDERLPQTRTAWKFLRPYAEAYDHAIFSAPEYIPDYLSKRSSIIHPALDPLSHKNRPLRPHKLMGVLCDAGLTRAQAPLLTPPFPAQAQRLQADNHFRSALDPDEIGLLHRNIISQVSRWDRLKGFAPLMEGFVRLKKRLKDPPHHWDERQRHRLELVRLVLAGPEPGSVQDDPEAKDVLDELRAEYCALAPEYQKDIVLLALPMDSVKHNALMVNALQHCSTIVVQNSLREGFGLTATEAMWKGIPVMGTQACGLRQQIRDGLDGRLICDPEDPEEIADVLDQMLGDPLARDRWGRNAQLRAHNEFLIFTQLCRWIKVLAASIATPAAPIPAPAREYAPKLP